MAGKQSNRDGLEKAAVVLMSLDEEVVAKIFALMSEAEIRQISSAMSNIGTVKPDEVDNLSEKFLSDLGSTSSVTGTAENTRQLLEKALGAERVSSIMDSSAVPDGKDTWDKLNNVNEEVLATYLQNEYPQTAALILSKVRSSQASRVLSVLPEDLSLDIIKRMITIEPVKTEVLIDIEQTLQKEFVNNLASSSVVDSFEIMAEIFNNFNRNTENKFFEFLDKDEPATADKIRELMFTFDDLIKIDGAGIQTMLRTLDKDKLAIALKGSSDEIRDLFFDNMSERASKILKEDMESTGPVRIKDVDEAQMVIVNTAKELSDSGEIVIPDGDSEEEMIG